MECVHYVSIMSSLYMMNWMFCEIISDMKVLLRHFQIPCVHVFVILLGEEWNQMKTLSEKYHKNLFFIFIFQEECVKRMVFVIRYPDMCSPSSPAKRLHERKSFCVRIIWCQKFVFFVFFSLHLKMKTSCSRTASILFQLDAIKVASSHYDVHFVFALVSASTAMHSIVYSLRLTNLFSM